ncbi:BMP family lipoprotein [Streptomyces diastatochromogenes]|uniref:BMP family ABC transporter substrate-binding protein n=1 Tax=Streptomyces diastatochromogenes TaxID=42236 RepID=A0A233SRY7_STRDA|nr:BMP family ABC transporter substrate-binding protein [Streptomyces diastatochromogenes]MCZ0987329.1 BMP family ABC transporter substrate-binding protein [Streptomyces diastatochromogenes]OXY98400.1 BMP family ABC transporter substrate-binding protein [Streptomyces diastatochromogenes]
MRRVSRITIAGVATAALAVTVSACGSSSTSSSSSTEGKSKGIGLAYDVGGKGDQSFNDAAYAGFEKAQKDFGVGGRDVEPTDNESDADKTQRLITLAKAGYNPVIGVGFAYAGAVKEAAQKFPKVTFGIIDDNQTQANNVADMVFHEEQSSYLAGVAAAKATKKNHIGFIGGVDVPLIHKFEAGYEQGAKSVNPKIKIESQYLTQTAQEGGFSSPDKGENAANGQIDAGADVVYAAAGLSGQGVIKSAAEHKVWAIGVDSDQYKQQALAKYKAYILTSALKNVEGAVYDLSKSVIKDKKPLTGEIRGSLDNGGVGLSDSNPTFQKNADMQAAIKKAEQGIKDGSIKVKTS